MSGEASGPSVNELLSNVSIPASVCLPLVNPEAVHGAFTTLFEQVRSQAEELAATKRSMEAVNEENRTLSRRVLQVFSPLDPSPAR